MVSSSAPARSNDVCFSERRSATTALATTAAVRPIGRLMSSTQRQLSSWVITPPSSVPAAPPAPFIAPHSPTAR